MNEKAAKKLGSALYTALTIAAVLLAFWLGGRAESVSSIRSEDLLCSLSDTELTRSENEIGFLLDSFPCHIVLEDGQATALSFTAQDPLKEYKSYIVVTEAELRSSQRAQALLRGGMDEDTVCRVLYGELTLAQSTRDKLLEQKSATFSSALSRLTQQLCSCGLLTQDECAQCAPEWLDCYRSMEEWERQLAHCTVSVCRSEDALCFSFSGFFGDPS